MKPFVFRAQRILDWRQRLADDARGEFVRAAETAREALRAAEEAEGALAHASQTAARAFRGATGVATLERHRIWIVSEQRRAEHCRRTYRERQQTADEKAAALQLATRQVRVLERLRERSERRHRDLERKLELKALDELATVKYARQRAEQGAERER